MARQLEKAALSPPQSACGVDPFHAVFFCATGAFLAKAQPGGSARLLPSLSGGSTREASITQEKVERRPGSLSMTRRLWWRLSTCLTIESPRPVPPDSRERLEDTR